MTIDPRSSSENDVTNSTKQKNVLKSGQTKQKMS